MGDATAKVLKLTSKTASKAIVYLISRDGKNEINLLMPTAFEILPGVEYHVICTAPLGNWRYLGSYDISSFSEDELVVSVDLGENQFEQCLAWISRKALNAKDAAFDYIVKKMVDRGYLESDSE
jgi:hypothetical protein